MKFKKYSIINISVKYNAFLTYIQFIYLKTSQFLIFLKIIYFKEINSKLNECFDLQTVKETDSLIKQLKEYFL